jgi:DnaK suppressor protein
MAARATTSAARTRADTGVSAGKTAAKKAAAKKTTSTKAASAKGTAAKTTAKATAKKPAAKKTTAAMLVKPDEKPWTAKELAALRSELEAGIAQLEREIEDAEAELFDLMHDGGDGAGDDQADAGAKTYEREQEISLANNARDLLDQNRRALERMDDGSYGVCESCGSPIGKLRLQAAPRATLCMPCKTKEERR